MQRALIRIIDGYRYVLSPMLGTNCRFHPSCSCYARDAVETYGATKGLMLAIRRIIRCHPWNAGGYDPVPAKNFPSTDMSTVAIKDFHG